MNFFAPAYLDTGFAPLQAFASYAAAITAQPLHTEALVACAAVYRISGQLLNAIHSLETATAAAPTDAAVQRAHAAALNALGKPGLLLGCNGSLFTRNAAHALP